MRIWLGRPIESLILFSSKIILDDASKSYLITTFQDRYFSYYNRFKASLSVKNGSHELVDAFINKTDNISSIISNLNFLSTEDRLAMMCEELGDGQTIIEKIL